jgi:YggT family protein
MGADMGVKQAKGWRVAKLPKFFGYANIGIHRAPPPPELPFVTGGVNQNAAERIALLGVGRYLCHNPLWLEPPMTSVLQILLMILDIAKWIILIHIIMSWLINFQVLNLRQSLVAQIWYGLNRLLDPIYSRVRRVLPNVPGLDLAPLIVLLVIYGLRIVVYNNMYSFS